MVWLLLRCTVGSSPLLAVAVSSVAAGGGFGASLWAPPIRRPVRSTPTLFWVCIQVACLWCIAAAVSLGASVVPAALWLGVSPLEHWEGGCSRLLALPLLLASGCGSPGRKTASLVFPWLWLLGGVGVLWWSSAVAWPSWGGAAQGRPLGALLCWLDLASSAAAGVDGVCAAGLLLAWLLRCASVGVPLRCAPPVCVALAVAATGCRLVVLVVGCWPCLAGCPPLALSVRWCSPLVRVALLLPLLLCGRCVTMHHRGLTGACLSCLQGHRPKEHVEQGAPHAFQG